jgi:hypothetical protein
MMRPRWLRRTWARLIAARAADVAPVRRAWTALGDVPGDEARAGALLRQAIVREPMSDTQLASVRARLRRNRAPSARGARFMQLAAGLAVMLAAGVLLAAAGRFLGWSVLEPARRAVPATVEPQAVHRRAHARARSEVAAPPVAVVPPAEAPLPAVSEPVRPGPAAPPHAPRPARIVASRATTLARSEIAGGDRAAPAATGVAPAPAPAAVSVEQPPPSSATSRLAEESGLLTLALRKLRQDDDPAGALATLDEHARRFGPAGALVVEADTARVEALLRLGRHADALVRLEGLALAPTGSSRGLLAARAELRAEQGRCAAAVADFDRLLARAAAHDAIVERALHGRASCRAQVGDVAGARADLETYLTRFPDGRFAAEARSMLRR